jgi:Na+:H+ antiporter
MVPRGERGLIIAEVGRRDGILGDSVHAVIVFVVAVMPQLAPLALKPPMKDQPEVCSV